MNSTLSASLSCATGMSTFGLNSSILSISFNNCSKYQLQKGSPSSLNQNISYCGTSSLRRRRIVTVCFRGAVLIALAHAPALSDLRPVPALALTPTRAVKFPTQKTGALSSYNLAHIRVLLVRSEQHLTAEEHKGDYRVPNKP